MSLRKIRIVRIVCLVIILAAWLLCYLLRDSSDETFYKVILAAGVIPCVLEIVCWFLWRCPHCRRMLHIKGTLFIQYCPHCGEDLFDD